MENDLIEVLEEYSDAQLSNAEKNIKDVLAKDKIANDLREDLIRFYDAIGYILQRRAKKDAYERGTANF